MASVFSRSVFGVAVALVLACVGWLVAPTMAEPHPAHSLGLSLRAEPSPSRSARRVEPSAPPADRDLVRGVRHMLPGGALYVPATFRARDGSFDLLIHFHGNTELVEQSVEHAGLNALVLVVNLGEGSRRYMDALAAPRVFDKLTEQSARAVEEQGLRRASLRRVALSAWSAGYGAVRQILRLRGERIDAVLLMDGLHAPYADKKKLRVDGGHLAPFVAFSRLAAAGERLMMVTHSNIQTYHYASAAQTADFLVKHLRLARAPVDPADKPRRVRFDAARRATPSDDRVGLVPISRASRNGLTVLAFRGDSAEHHIAHLVQMSVTVLPPLVERWRAPRTIVDD